VVTCCPPILPAILVPLNTRDGVAQAPIDPGERLLLVVPVRGALALEVVSLHPAGKTLALGDGDGVDQFPGLEQVGGQLLPTSNSEASSSRSSTSLRPGSTPALSKWPRSGLVNVVSRRWPQVTCSAE